MSSTELRNDFKALDINPSLKNYIENFDVFSLGPGGVVKLRQLILRSAVAGKLHEYISSDGSAKLLKSLRAQREEKVKLKEIRKGKTFPEIEKVYFETPAHWIWARLGEWGDWGSGATPSRSKSAFYGGDIPWFKSGELTGDIISESEETITQDAVDNSSVRLRKAGDVLIAMYGATIGKTAILGVQATTNQAVCACTCFDGIDNEYLLLLLKAYNDIFTGQGAGGAQPNISREKVINTPAPLPPLEEQKHIVTKVDELMTLCDQLEVQQQQQANTLLKANNAVIQALLSPENSKDDLKNDWQRLSDNFHTLYSNTLPMPLGEGRQKKHLVGIENVKHLRKAILQLAVMGKLVINSGDNTALDALEVINCNIDKKKLAKLKKLKPMGCLYKLPDSWIWLPFWKVADIESNLVKPDAYRDKPHIAPNHIEKDTARLLDYTTVGNDKVISSKHYFYSGQILYSKIRPNLNKLVIVDFEGLCSADMYPIRSKINTRYLCLFMLSNYFIEQAIADDNRVAMPKVNQERLNSIAVPVPPLDEQKRIVAKVDGLMGLCDQLEQQLTTAYIDAEKLISATTKALVA